MSISTSVAIVKTKAALRRTRARRRLQQGVLDGKTPNPHHDILVVAPEGVHANDERFRVPVVKIEDIANQGEIDEPAARQGTYADKPELLDSYDYAQRRVGSIARPHDWGTSEERGTPRGPAFGTLPVKREPAATSCASCYLIDAQNLTFINAWTAEEWTDIDAPDLPPASSADDPFFEVLLAGPRGRVFHLYVNLDENAPWPAQGKRVPIGALTADGLGELGSICDIKLRHEMELWSQLRNGTVVGRVMWKAKPGVVPLVNVTSLIPPEPDSQTEFAVMAEATHTPRGKRKGPRKVPKPVRRAQSSKRK